MTGVMWIEENSEGMVVLRRSERLALSVLTPTSPWSDLDRRLAVRPSAAYIIDMSQERFLTSEALAVMVGLVRRVQQAGGRLALAGAQPSVVGVLESMRLSRLVVLAADVPAARAALGR